MNSLQIRRTFRHSDSLSHDWLRASNLIFVVEAVEASTRGGLLAGVERIVGSICTCQHGIVALPPHGVVRSDVGGVANAQPDRGAVCEVLHNVQPAETQTELRAKNM